MGTGDCDQRGQPGPKSLTPAEAVWHELVLAGVGGRTVAEAKEAISLPEFQAWMAYRAEHGPLHLAERLEWVGALIAHTVASTIPRKRGARAPKFEDFLPQRRKPEDETPITLDEAMLRWR